MKVQKHVNGFIGFALKTFVFSFLITSIVWVVSRIIETIIDLLRRLVHSKQHLEDTAVQEAIAYYAIYGQHCPTCDMHVPIGMRCANCGHVFIELLPEYKQKLLKGAQD